MNVWDTVHGAACVLPQALCVSTDVSELGEYFLLPSERSLSEWQMDGLHGRTHAGLHVAPFQHLLLLTGRETHAKMELLNIRDKAKLMWPTT